MSNHPTGVAPMINIYRTNFLVPAIALATCAGAAFAQVSNVTGTNMPNPTGDVVSIDGTVKEIFGNKFIIEDANGRKLIETGPRGQDIARVAVGDRVKVDGRNREGFTHAGAITLANGQRVTLDGPGLGPGPRGPGGGAFNQDAILGSVRNAGYSDARIQDVKKHHAEVIASNRDGKRIELHVEFDGNIRKIETITSFDEQDVKALIEKAGYSYAGSMRPEKKHMVVSANNSRGERVEIDVHRDGSIKKEKRVF